jgi:hypothetical protein
MVRNSWQPWTRLQRMGFAKGRICPKIPNYDEETSQHWYVFHPPDASATLADDVYIQRTTRKKPLVTHFG